jgi:hypothetical protein
VASTTEKPGGPVKSLVLRRPQRSPSSRSGLDSAEVVELEQSLIMLRRNCCVGLQLLMFTINSINSQFMTGFHEMICCHAYFEAEAHTHSCRDLFQRHDSVLNSVSSVIDLVKDSVSVLVVKGFAAVSSIKG